ncbi:MAG: gamma-glutamyltransferase family protein [Candidatus Bathyarchaeota archaeon]|nr:MAG: gamma-glutamyltransferase family protein [Candidatus Bathyarchaeota archaeon]
MEFTTRPVIMGTNGMVSSTHYLATEGGLMALKRGGNVVDAGATMWFSLTVLKPYLAGVAGEVPILVYWADEGRVLAVNGQGPAPAAATMDWFKDNGYRLIPEDGFLPAVVPGAFDAWLTLLDEYGSMSLEEVLDPAIKLAEEGFPVYPSLKRALTRNAERFKREWPTSAEVYLPGGKVSEVGSLIKNPDWARTFKKVAEAERRERRWGRSAGIDAARDYFYRGLIAETIVDFMQTFKCRDVYGQEHHGLLTLEDFAGYRARIEEPITSNYRGFDVYKCDTWCQGAVLLQQLNLLEGFDLASMGHNTVEYLHTYVECAKLAFADRERYYADPDFVDVPLGRLLSKEYATDRRGLVDPDHASLEMRPGGVAPYRLRKSEEGDWFEGDTVHLEAVDGSGNMLSATPSGAWIRTSPLIPGLGFCMGTRGQMFHLDPNHVERLEPGKKPSTTLTPSLVMRDDKPYMVFGTPGGDNQDQWTLQFFLNHVDFGMNVQLALDQPTVHTRHVSGSFWPHAAYPGRVYVEPRIPGEVVEGMERRDHEIVVSRPWSHGRCLAIRYDPETGVMFGGASPRTCEAYAIGW